MVSTMLVGLLMVSALESSGAVLRSRRQLGDQRLAAALCERYLTEVLESYYVDPDEASPNFGTESESTRAEFDDVDDYQDWSESPPKSESGTALTGYSGWSVNIAVALVNPANPDGAPTSDMGLKRVIVTVTNPLDRQTVLKGLRAKLGADEKAPYVRRNHVQWVGLNLRTKNATTTLYRGTQPIDQARVGN